MTDTIDEEVLLGAGQELDTSFDFTVDGTGDISSSRGSEELEKDIAFNTALFLQPLVGGVLTNRVKTDIIETVISVAEEDDRVRAVFEESISVEETREGGIRVSLAVDTISTVEDLVINV
jgi:hypothetical protein